MIRFVLVLGSIDVRFALIETKELGEIGLN